MTLPILALSILGGLGALALRSILDTRRKAKAASKQCYRHR
jgi:type II secretory pathway pseudopilin PulG